MPTRDELIERALALPPDDRAFVLGAIRRSLLPREMAPAGSDELERQNKRGEPDATATDKTVE